MKNSDMPAMPITLDMDKVVTHSSVPKEYRTGLTKREHFAAMAMHGIISSGNLRAKQEELLEGVSRAAVEYADALLAELEK